jgi:hypothetical protein
MNKKITLTIFLLSLIIFIPLVSGSPSGYIFGNPIKGQQRYSAISLSTSTNALAIVFRSQYSDNITEIDLYISNVVSAPYYRVGIQLASYGGVIGGRPSGVWLTYVDTNSFTANAMNVFVVPKYLLNSQTVYAVVVAYVNGTVGGSNYITVPADILSNNYLISGNSQLFYDNYFRMNTNSGDWGYQSFSPCFLIGTESCGFFGQPYASLAYNSMFYSNSLIGQNFSLPCNSELDSLSIWSTATGGTVPFNVTFSIYDKVSGSYVVNNQFLFSSNWIIATSITNGWYTGFFGTPIFLKGSNQYLLIFNTTGSSGVTMGYGFVFSDSWQSYSWGNSTFIMFSGTNANILSSPTLYLNRDLMFYMGLSNHWNDGNFTGYISGFNDGLISVTPSPIPEETTTQEFGDGLIIGIIIAIAISLLLAVALWGKKKW